MRDDDGSHVAEAWAVLYGHPALTWTPPLWRGHDEAAPPDRLLTLHAVRAVERNLLVQVLSPPDRGEVVICLSTGPMQDRPLGDGVDPVTPVAVRDARLDVQAATFEEAICELARRVVEVYGR